MDLKKSQKNKIINDVFKGDSNSEWSILIYDKSTAKIMTNLFTQSELITHNIVLSQRIEEKREKADFPVVYFVLCTKENLKIINQEYDQNQYNSFRVCSLNTNIDLNPNIPFKIIFMNYVALEDKVFLSSIPDIYSVANTLNLNFYVEFTLKSLEFECKKLDESFGEERNGKILIFDRSLDLFTPLGHFFTFQAFLSDIYENKVGDQGGSGEGGGGNDRGGSGNDRGGDQGNSDQGNTNPSSNNNNPPLSNPPILFPTSYMDSRLWKEIRYAHLGELNDIFKTYAHDVSVNMKKLESDIDTKELMKMVLSAPETLKMNEMLKKFFELAGECYESFENISSFIEKEQIILTGFDKLKNKSKLGFNDLLEIFGKQNVEHSDKLRLYHLFRFSGYEFKSEEKRKLKEFGFKDEELKNNNNFIYFKPLKYNYKYDYDVSRYEPTVSVILREYLVKNKKLVEIFKLKRESSQLKSLRKSYLLSVKPEINKKKIYIVYIRGGVTYPEIASIQKLTELLGTEILIGSDKIIRPREFLKEISE